MSTVAVRSLAAPLLAAIALAGFLAVPATSTGGQAVVPDPALEPAIAGGRHAAMAFAGSDAHRSVHVHVAVPASADPVELGPRLPGDDGAPVIVELSGGGYLVVASRSGSGGSLLWSQAFDGRRWAAARVLPGVDRESHHPTLAGDGETAWAAWVSGDGSDGDERILAARWDGANWGAPEEVPSAPGAPGVPVIAIGPRGRPALIWAARDAGADTEIWLARRRSGGWASPRRLTANDVPDTDPHAAYSGSTLIVAWATLTPDGYRIRGLAVDGRGRVRRRRISDMPGSAPRVVAGSAGAQVVWSTPWREDPSVTEIRVTPWDAHHFRRSSPLAHARNARTAVAPGRSREWLAAWHDGVDVTAAVVTPVRRGAPHIRALRGAARRWSLEELQLEFPGSYLAFGDSITAGTVRYDGVVSFVEGYPVHLGSLISQLFGQSVIVAERAMPGERTPDGLNRLRAVMSSEPRKVVLINEGANDFSNLADPSTVVENLLAMTAVVRERDALPVLSTVLPRREANFGGGANRRIDLANDMILSRGRQAALLVDMHPAFDGNDAAYSDYIHPNAKGYVLMAEVWFRGLLPVLNSLIREPDIDRALDDAAAQALKPGRLDRLQ